MKSILLTLALSGFACAANATQLGGSDLGQTAPTPGTYDISQLMTTGDTTSLPDYGSLNQFYDNTANSAGYVGSSFTTGADPGGYTMTSLSLKFGGGQPVGYAGGADTTLDPGWTISIYQLTGTGYTNATLVYQNTVGALTGSGNTGGDWIQITGFNQNLAPNAVYAWTIFSSGYDDLGYATGKPYSGGTICQIPSAGGAVTYATDNDSATFEVGLTANTVLLTATDLGSAAPSAGPADAAQLSTAGDSTPLQDGALNELYDNTGSPGYVGTSFTTGSNPGGYALNSLSVKFGGTATGGYAGGEDTGSSWGGWIISFYQLSGAGDTNAVLVYDNTVGLNTNQSNSGGDWIQISGFYQTLLPNTVYAWTIDQPNGYDDLAYATGTPYGGGTICAIPPGGGLVTYAISADNASATFDVGLTKQGFPNVGSPTATPNPVYALSPVALSDTASGPGTLTYQWQLNSDLTGNLGGTWNNILNATNTTLTYTPPNTPGTYDIRMVVNNAAGASPSGPVALTVYAAQAPSSSTGVTPATIQTYPGGDVSFSDSSFVGTTPITYQWQANTGSGYQNISSVLNPSAATTTLNLTNVQAGNAGSYRLVAMNSQGTVNDSSVGVGTLSFLTPPALPTSSNPQNVPYVELNDTPYAYWRLQETNNPGSIPPVLAYDYSGHGFFATYGSGTATGVTGPQSPAFPGFSSSELAVYTTPSSPTGMLNVPALNLTTNTVSFVAWINPDQAEVASAGLLFCRNGGDAAGFGFNGNPNGSSMPCLGFTWNQNGSDTWGWNSGLYPLVGVWSLVAYVITPTNETTYLYYVDPTSHKPVLLQNSISLANQVETFSIGSFLGADPQQNRTFSGSIAEAALYQAALSQDQVLNIFATALDVSGFPPSPPITLPMASLFAGTTYQFNGTAGGPGPITYQWMSSANDSTWTNVPASQNYSGTTGPILTINNATIANSLYYEVVAHNNSGTTTSGAGQLTVAAVPTGLWTVNFQLTNNTDEYGFVHLGSYSGNGVLGTGTYWNAINDPYNAFVYGTFDSVSDLEDNGTTHSGVSVTISGDGFTSQTTQTPAGSIQTLLDQYIQVNNATLQINGVPDGMYNLAVYTIDGSFANDSDGVTVNAANGSPSAGCVNMQDKYFSPGDNTSLFTGVQAMGGNLSVTIGAGGTGGADFCGLQLQLVSLANTVNDIPLSYTVAGKTLTLTWTEGVLQAATNVTGPWTTIETTSPHSVNMTIPAQYFRLMIPNP